MSNIYFKVSFETFLKLRSSGFRKFVIRSVFGDLQLMQISSNFKTSSCNLKIRSLEQNGVWLFYYFNFERNYDVLKSENLCIFLNKNINFNENVTESKMENTTHRLERRTLCFSSYKNRKLKVKLWWVGARERKKRAFFVPFILLEGKFLEIYILSQCIVYWIHLYTFKIYILFT